MRTEAHDLTGWMEWGEEYARPTPGVATALGLILPEKPSLPSPVHNILTIFKKTRDSIVRIQRDWDTSTEFQFHLLGNHSAFMRPKAFENIIGKHAVSGEKAVEVIQTILVQKAEQERYAKALGLPGEAEELFKKLEQLYGSAKAADVALMTIAIMAGCRVVIRELLELLRNPSFMALKNVEEVAQQSITLEILEPHDSKPEDPSGLF